MKIYCIILLSLIALSGCVRNNVAAQTQEQPPQDVQEPEQVLLLAAEDTAMYLPLVKEKKTALVANPTSQAFGRHLLDVLLDCKVDVRRVFAPEHGFRGEGEPGQTVSSEVDQKTGIKIVSLFGNNLKPTPAQMQGLDVVVYDIQDVGCRFFTYISTLHKVMEACAENNVELVVLDRPNPNIDMVDGPVRESNCVSFVSLDPLPIVYGMTVGELANMINEEGWLAGKAKCKLKVVPMRNYSRSTRYELPIKPSPNLPSYLSVRMYPSLCMFEATSISVGRGTQQPFTKIGFPDAKYGEYVFTPEDIPGMQTNPLHKAKKCYGIDFTDLDPDSQKFTLKYFIDMYKISGGTSITKKKWLSLLYGNDKLPEQLASGMSEEQIRKTWEPKLSEFKKLRAKYLVYE